MTDHQPHPPDAPPPSPSHSRLDDALARLESAIAALCQGGDVAQRAAEHLLARPGKRIRPWLVLVSAELGADPARRHHAEAVALAVELIHTASLLHDDVIDLGEERRGAPTSRIVFGNTASILAGDLLLVEALAAARRAREPRVEDEMIDALRSIVAAEARQHAHRGRPIADPAVVLAIAEGKTAALFTWAMRAGALAAGAPESAVSQLGAIGRHLGLAFQIADDLIDLTTSPATSGKSTLRDLREGKANYPLALALAVEPALGALLAPSADAIDPALALEVLERTGARAQAEAASREHLDLAAASMAKLPDPEVRRQLEVLLGKWEARWR